MADAATLAALHERFGLDLNLFRVMNLTAMRWGDWNAMWLLALGGLCWLALNPKTKQLASSILLWIAGLLIACIGIPQIDYTVAEHLKRIPLQIDFYRSYRYLFPMGIIVLLWLPAVMVQSNPYPIIKASAYAAICAFTFWLWPQALPAYAPITASAQKTMDCLFESHSFCK